MKFAHDRWSKRIMDGCYLFSNHDTSNIPNLLHPTINLSLASQTKCDSMFSDPKSDHIFSYLLGTYLVYIFFLSYVVIILLLWRGEGAGIYCPLITDWIESTQAQILFPRQIQNGDTEPNSKYCLKEYLNIAYSNTLTLFKFFGYNCILSL